MREVSAGLGLKSEEELSQMEKQKAAANSVSKRHRHGLRKGGVEAATKKRNTKRQVWARLAKPSCVLPRTWDSVSELFSHDTLSHESSWAVWHKERVTTEDLLKQESCHLCGL